MSLTGIDLVIEGVAERVTDDDTLQRLAKRYADQGWAPTVKDGAFTHEYSAPRPCPRSLHAVKDAVLLERVRTRQVSPQAAFDEPVF